MGALWRGPYRLQGGRRTLLERAFNFPPLSVLTGEVQRIRDLQRDLSVSLAAHG